METPHSNHISTYALRFISGTALSRVFGMLRDVSMAFFFGATPMLGAFFVAYRLSHLFRRIFAEGGLLNGFIPFFEEKRQENEKEAHLFFRDLFWSLSLILFVLIIFLELGIGFYFLWVGKNSILFLTAIMLPSLLFICLYGLFSAYLNCYNRFFLSGFAPTIFNVIWIIAAFGVHYFIPEVAMKYLSMALVWAFLGQWLFTSYYVRRSLLLTQKEWWTVQLFSPSVRAMITPFVTVTIGVSATQINQALDAVFARAASLEGPPYLTFPSKIQQIPIAFFAVAMATALLPSLSSAFQKKERLLSIQYIEHVLSRSLLFLIPSSFGILSVGYPIIALIFGHGQFNHISVMRTTECFWGYGLSLIPSALVIILTSVLYAQKNYRIPTLLAFFSIGLNIGFNYLLIYQFHCGAYSVALSTAIGSLIHMSFLWVYLKKILDFKLSIPFKRTTMKIGIVSLLSAIFSILAMRLANQTIAFPFLQETWVENTHKLMAFVIPFCTFILCFFAGCHFFKVNELKDFLSFRLKSG
ncbi:MAG: murein biosynthesis integral membrane protein MurJ [Simkaniaceae bacterium]|nr:murein biosynthesis integral membrane protein MurJ [Simkaniaceae bacterium]